MSDGNNRVFSQSPQLNIIQPRNSDEISSLQLPATSHRKSVFNTNGLPGIGQSVPISQAGSQGSSNPQQQPQRGRSTSRVLDMGLQFQLQPQKKRYTLTRAIGLATKVQRFVRLISSLISGKQALKRLTPRQLQVIGDKSYFTEEEIRLMSSKDKGGYSQNRSLREDPGAPGFTDKQFLRSKAKMGLTLKNYQPT